MRKIFKYVIPADENQPIYVPAGSRFLSLICQNDTPVVYFLTDPATKEMEKIYFRVVGTGEEVDEKELDEYWIFVDTVQQYGGKFVWHIWMSNPFVEYYHNEKTAN